MTSARLIMIHHLSHVFGRRCTPPPGLEASLCSLGTREHSSTPLPAHPPAAVSRRDVLGAAVVVVQAVHGVNAGNKAEMRI